MADDNKKDDDSGEHTQYQPLRPPTLGQPPKKEEPAPAGEDRTQAGGAPPPLLKKPAAAPPPPPPPPPASPPSAVEEATDHTIADIPTKGTRPSPGPPPPSGGFEDEGATVVLAPSQRATCSLQRIEPPGHGDVITLNRDAYLLGRSRTCDIPLYSSTASREHARLSKRDDAWYLRPEEGKTIIAAGSTVSGEVRLVHKMRLQLGGDELLFFDERAATAPAARPAAAAAGVEEKRGSRTGLIAAIVAVVIVAAAVAAYLLLFQS